MTVGTAGGVASIVSVPKPVLDTLPEASVEVADTGYTPSANGTVVIAQFPLLSATKE